MQIQKQTQLTIIYFRIRTQTLFPRNINSFDKKNLSPIADTQIRQIIICKQNVACHNPAKIFFKSISQCLAVRTVNSVHNLSGEVTRHCRQLPKRTKISWRIRILVFSDGRVCLKFYHVANATNIRKRVGYF